MKKAFKIFQKKKTTYLIGAVWIFLLLIELSSISFGEGINVDSPVNGQSAALHLQQDLNLTASSESLSVENFQQHLDGHSICHDDCLCHTTPLLTQNAVSFIANVTIIPQIPDNYGEAIVNFLPPPYHPPKHS